MTTLRVMSRDNETFSRDRYDTLDVEVRDRDETETLNIEFKSRPRRDVGTSRGCLETSRPRLQPWRHSLLSLAIAGHKTYIRTVLANRLKETPFDSGPPSQRGSPRSGLNLCCGGLGRCLSVVIFGCILTHDATLLPDSESQS